VRFIGRDPFGFGFGVGLNPYGEVATEDITSQTDLKTGGICLVQMEGAIVPP
jgi:hypothetical protein